MKGGERQVKKLIIGLFLSLIALFVVPTSVQAVSNPKNLNAVTGKHGQVTLYWDFADDARTNQYSLSYGEGQIGQYGAANIGEDKNIMMSYTVKNLKPGVKYCFTVSAQVKGESSAYSNVDCAYAGGQKQYYSQYEQVSQPVTQTQAQTQTKAKPVGASTQEKYQGTMKTDHALNPAEETTGRRGVGKHNLRAVSGPNYGEVTLYWNQDNAVDYHVMYTDEKGNWKYGVLNVGKTHAYTIKNLSSAQRYYFAIVPVYQYQTGAESFTVSELAR